MAQASMQTLQRIAVEVRKYITPYLEQQGYIDNATLRTLVRKHTARNLTTERTLNRLQHALTEL